MGEFRSQRTLPELKIRIGGCKIQNQIDKGKLLRSWYCSLHCCPHHLTPVKLLVRLGSWYFFGNNQLLHLQYYMSQHSPATMSDEDGPPRNIPRKVNTGLCRAGLLELQANVAVVTFLVCCRTAFVINIFDTAIASAKVRMERVGLALNQASWTCLLRPVALYSWVVLSCGH